MPTRLPRHTITETADVRAALDELRRETGEKRIGLPELVILGAQEKARQIRARRTADDELVQALAARVRRREPLVDPAAADDVRRGGWARG